MNVGIGSWSSCVFTYIYVESCLYDSNSRKEFGDSLNLDN